MKYVIKKKILIKSEHIPSEDKYAHLDLNKINKEQYFKEIFIKILKDNYDGSVIKLVDLKKQYTNRIKTKSYFDKRLDQILKNVIGSNKGNSTHLLRDPRVDWFFSRNENGDSVVLEEDERKPIPLPPKSEFLDRYRSNVVDGTVTHRKKFYAFFSFPVDDSPIITSVRTEEERSISHQEANDYNDIDFENIKKNKRDFVKKQKDAQRIGEIGENHIFDFELKELKKMRINKRPIWISKDNDSYGFDILSYRMDRGVLKRVFIEVKTTSGDLENEFYASRLEIDISNRYKNNYIIARVFHASESNRIEHKYFDGSFDDNFDKIDQDRGFVFKTR